MSDLGPQDAGVEKRGRYGRKLRQLQKQLETALSNLQIAEEKHIYIMERAHVLSDLIATQDCMKQILDRHRSWLHSSNSAADTEPTTHESPSVSLQSAPGLSVDHQRAQLMQGGLYQVATATPEQLRAALDMTVDDWVQLTRSMFHQLLLYLELVGRPTDACPEASNPSDSCQALDNDSNPAAAAEAAAPTAAAAESSRAPMQELRAYLMETGRIHHSALLHGSPALLAAGALNNETLQHEMPPPSHWQRVVQRLQLTPEQQMYFKIAWEEHARMTRAAAMQGLTLVEQTNNYTCLSAVAEQFSSSSNGRSSNGRCSSSSPSTDTAGAAAASNGHTATAAAGSGSSANGDAAKEETSSFQMDMLDENLREHLKRMFLNMYLLNIFLTNILTPYQHAVMWVASYPYWPIMGAMAEALLTMPDYRPLPPTSMSELQIRELREDIQAHIHNRIRLMKSHKRQLLWWEEDK